MLRKDGKIELLRGVPLFAGCSKLELGEIARIADEIDFKAGKTLISQGDPARQFFVLIDGSVDVQQDGKPLAPRGGTEFYGEIALISGGPATATVTTSTPVRALAIAPRHFKALLERSPSIQLRVLRSMSERLAPYTV